MSAQSKLLEETAEELYENAPCGYIATTPDGAIARANQTFVTWSGYSRDELLAGKRFQDVLNLAGKIFYDTHFAPLLQMQGFINEIAFELIRKDGQPLSILVNATQKQTADGTALGNRITIFNATERRRYERDLLEARRKAEQVSEELRLLNDTLEERINSELAERMKAEAALRQAQKMEAIGHLTGGIAHDFNNLLTIVIGNIEILLRHLPPDAVKLRRSADHALQGAQRAATLTHRLLAFSRQQPLEPKPIEPNKLVSGMSELLRRTLGETVQLETVLAGGIWRTEVDPNQLENAVLNLAVNARDAMPEGGRLTIETANSHLDRTYVAALPEPVPPGQYVLVAVTDTGSGMRPEIINRVFEPFFTTKEAGKGTGLGLSQVYGFVRQSGGHVKIYSELGEGTTVKIYLPRHFGKEQEEGTVNRAGSDYQRADGETVLVVEDEEDVRNYAEEALGELGYRVITASDGPAALRMIEQEHDVDLVFTDIVLPGGLNGQQLAQIIVDKRPGMKVLFASGYTRNAIVHNGRLDHDVQMIGKPFTFDELATRVRSVLDT